MVAHISEQNHLAEKLRADHNKQLHIRRKQADDLRAELQEQKQIANNFCTKLVAEQGLTSKGRVELAAEQQITKDLYLLLSSRAHHLAGVGAEIMADLAHRVPQDRRSTIMAAQPSHAPARGADGTSAHTSGLPTSDTPSKEPRQEASSKNGQEQEDKSMVEEIVGSRFGEVYSRFEYRVKWKGRDELSWEPLKTLNASIELVASYHKKWPLRARPDNATDTFPATTLPTSSASNDTDVEAQQTSRGSSTPGNLRGTPDSTSGSKRGRDLDGSNNVSGRLSKRRCSAVDFHRAQQ